MILREEDLVIKIADMILHVFEGVFEEGLGEGLVLVTHLN